MPNLPTSLAQAIASLGLTIPQAARKIGGNTAGYKAALKRLHRCTSSNNLPTSLALFEADLEALGLEITINNRGSAPGRALENEVIRKEIRLTRHRPDPNNPTDPSWKDSV